MKCEIRSNRDVAYCSRVASVLTFKTKTLDRRGKINNSQADEFQLNCVCFTECFPLRDVLFFSLKLLRQYDCHVWRSYNNFPPDDSTLHLTLPTPL